MTAHRGNAPDRAATFSQVFEHELQEICRSRQHRLSVEKLPDVDQVRKQLVGLAFSGGGIRSATFNLGILQALSDHRLLSRFDYLSAVSGGSYIGSWLTAWIHRLAGARQGVRQVETELAAKPYGIQEPTEPHPVHFLRKYSNYLTPRVGLITADTWAFVASYLTNLLLNLAVLVPALAALLLVPYILLLIFTGFAYSWPFLILWTTLWAVFAMAFMVLNLPQFLPEASQGDLAFRGPQRVLGLIALPVFGTAFSTTCILWRLGTASWPSHWWTWALAGALFYPALWISGCLHPRLRHWQATHGKIRDESGKEIRLRMILVSAAFSGAAAGVLLFLQMLFLKRWDYSGRSLFQVCAWGTPLTMVVFLLAFVLHLGVMGRDFPDSMREWWARMGGWFLRVSALWAILFGMVVFGPLLLKLMLRIPGGKFAPFALAVTWLIHTLLGLALGGEAPKKVVGTKVLLNFVVRLAPYVFMLGLMLALSVGIHLALVRLAGLGLTAGDFWSQTRPVETIRFVYWDLLWKIAYSPAPFSLLLLCLLAALLLAWRVDINEFSMHHRYRNRLARCFLGATNPDRRPQPFTGFDPRDDLYFGDLTRSGSEPHSHPGPYLILNATLNLVGGKELAFQKRKAKSFIFTPLYCGYERFELPHSQLEHPSATVAGAPVFERARQFKAYCPTYLWGAAPPGWRLAFRRSDATAERPKGLSLSTGMATSGAAVSPSMGHFTSPALAFLMTIFNVRLGQWFGNPRREKLWRRSGPRLGLKWLLYELFGLTAEESDYIYVSDGGHFENLGIYELVKRRCRVIVASDAGQDSKLKFGDLVNAIEKCRIDFGVDINIKPDLIANGQSHYVVGEILYDRPGPDPPGILIYLKTSLTGDEPLDVQSYKNCHQGFPHESTSDQWFDESQFESYRALGHHIGHAVCKEIKERIATLDGTS